MSLPVKRIASLLAFLFLLSGMAAGEDLHQREVDSLRSLLSRGEKDNGPGRAATLIALGRVYMIRSNYLSADSCFSVSLAIAQRLGNDSLAAETLRSKSIIYFFQHDYGKAMETDEQVLHLFEKIRDTLMIGFSLNSIADNYLQTGDSDRALDYYERVIPVFTTLHEQKGLAAVYANTSMLTHGNLRESIALRLKAKNIWDQHPVENILPTINLGNIGEGYLDLVRYGSWQRMPVSDTFPHDRTKLLAMGEGYLRAAIRMAGVNGDIEDSSYFTGVLAELEEQKGDFRSAYKDFRAYQNITDSIFSQENKNKLAKIENARSIERKNQEIATKELMIGNQHKKLWLLASCIALLAVTGGLLYRQGVIRKKNNRELQRLNAELSEANNTKARFFGILSHDLRSPVSRLLHFLQLQEMEPGLLTPQEVEEQTAKIRQSAKTVMETMESVLLWSKGQMDRFGPESAPVSVRALFDEVAALYADQDNITYSWMDEEGLTIVTDRNFMRSILYNLTANATRAVVNESYGSIGWRAWSGQGVVYLSISDNGPGIRDKRQLAALFEDAAVGGSNRGLGLHIVRDLARAIGCRLEVEVLPEGGMRFILRIDAPEMAS